MNVSRLLTFRHGPLFSAALAHAASVSGTVTDKTTGKPAAGDSIVLVDVQAGMGEVAHATTNAAGHYTLNEPGSGPYLIRVTHQGAGYFIAAPQGDAPGDIPVYDVAAKVEGVFIEADVFEFETDASGLLHVTERYFVHNNSTPPRTEWSPQTFEVALPPEATVAGVAAQRPTGLPTSVKLDPTGAKGHYAFNFPIQPDEGEKDTLFQLEYTVPYSDSKFTFHPLVSLPAQSIGVLLPKSMTFAAGSGSVFQPITQDPGIQTFVAKNAIPGKALEFTISPDSAMKSTILSMARANGIPADNVYIFDASRQSNRISANVSGFLGTTRISLTDNLLNDCTPSEVLAVLGHEMGHYVMNHIAILLTWFGLLALVGFAFVDWAFAG